jgi:hypothetical protein
MLIQHHCNAVISNGDKPNTGLDSHGVMVGAVYGF